MSKIRLVTSTEVTKKIVEKIILSPDVPIIAVGLKKIGINLTGPIVLFNLMTWDGTVYIFDVKKNKDMVINGGLSRLLESADLLKVFHDCRSDAAALHSQFDTKIQNIFDTQAAYALIMEQEHLPARHIKLGDLHAKYGGVVSSYSSQLMQQLSDDCNFWARRPLSKEMLHCAADSVIPLIPMLYEKMKSDIHPSYTQIFKELSVDFIHEYCNHKTSGKAKQRKSPRLVPAMPKYSPRDRKPPIMTLDEGRVHLLEKTMPLASPRTHTWK